MTDYKKQSVPLSGWDVAYAIGFSDVNKAIKNLKNVPKTINDQRFSVGKYVNVYFEISADYSDWCVIGTESGTKIGALARLKNFTCTTKVLQPVTGSEFDYEYKGKKYKTVNSTTDVFNYEIGVKLRMGLRWYETAVEGAHANSAEGTHHLVTDGSEKGIEISDDFIIHPEDNNLNDTTDIVNIALKQAIKDVIAGDVADEFTHIFATIDYTKIAADKLNWLKLVSHAHAVSTTGLQPDDVQVQPARYLQAMDAEKGYAKGTLIIVGMTDVSPKTEEGKPIIPPSIPADLVNLVPNGCRAGYAFNDKLIIAQLFMGHLTEAYECTLQDFKFTNPGRKTLQNKKAIKLKNKVTLDFNTYGHHPTVEGNIAADGLVISVQNAAIDYVFTTVYNVPRGVLGFGLPYDAEVLQTIKFSLDYTINSSKYAILSINGEPSISASVNPKYEEKSSGFWDIMSTFGSNLLENLVVMGLTMGLMMGGSAIAKGLGRGGKWVKGKIFNAEGKAVTVELGATAAAETESAFMQKVNREIAALEKSQAVITQESEEALVTAKQEGKVAASQSGRSIVWELVKFTFWQTVVSQYQQIYQNVKLSELTHDAMSKQFHQLVYGGIGMVNWGNQPDNTKFIVKEGGLTDGAFVIGLDIDFEHD